MSVKKGWTTVMKMPPVWILMEVLNAFAMKDSLEMGEIALVNLAILCIKFYNYLPPTFVLYVQHGSDLCVEISVPCCY